MKNASEFIGGLVAACDVTGAMGVKVREGFEDYSCLSFQFGQLDAPDWMAGGSVVSSCMDVLGQCQSFAARWR